MSANFSQLKKLDPIKEATSDFEIYDLDPSVTLIGRYAGESNKDYMNALIKMVTRRASRRNKTNVKSLAENRDQDRELYSKYVIISWSPDPVDSSGNPVEFNEEECFAFLTALPDYIFDDIRGHFSSIAEFLSENDEDGTEAGELSADS